MSLPALLTDIPTTASDIRLYPTPDVCKLPNEGCVLTSTNERICEHHSSEVWPLERIYEPYAVSEIEPGSPTYNVYSFFESLLNICELKGIEVRYRFKLDIVITLKDFIVKKINE